jgi:hypothetical protein
VPDDSDWQNSDGGWAQVLQEFDHPYDLAVTLTYNGLDQPLTLPFSAEQKRTERTAALFDFLPELLRDMAL